MKLFLEVNKWAYGAEMPFTREQVNDVKIIIKETICELLNDEKFLSMIADKVEQKLKFKETQQKVQELQKEIELLKKNNKHLQGDVELLQQHIKRKSIRIHGLPESIDENIHGKVINVFKEKLKVSVAQEDLENCFRIGRNQNGKRTVLVTFSQQNMKLKILQNRKALKGTGITIAEDMTLAKYTLLKMAMEKFGRHNVWYYGGNIRVKVDQTKHIIKTTTDLDNLN